MAQTLPREIPDAYGVEYTGNDGVMRILRIGFPTLDSAIDWINNNDPYNNRKSVARSVNYLTFNGMIVWHGKD